MHMFKLNVHFKNSKKNMIYLFALWFFSVVGVGFTLLNYSVDGDMSNAQVKSKYSTLQVTSNEAIERLKLLARTTLVEVSWNTSLFVALCSSFGFFAIEPLINSNSNQKILGWTLSVVLVFLLQDLVIRWKAAHRKNKIFFETFEILERLKLTTCDSDYINFTSKYNNEQL